MEAFHFQCMNVTVANRGVLHQSGGGGRGGVSVFLAAVLSHDANIVRFNEAGSPWSAPTHSTLGAQRTREAPGLCGTWFREASLVSSPASSLGLSPASLPRMRTLRKPLQKTPTCWERDGWKGVGGGGGGVGVDEKERRRERTSEKGAGKIMGEERGETWWEKMGV